MLSLKRYLGIFFRIINLRYSSFRSFFRDLLAFRKVLGMFHSYVANPVLCVTLNGKAMGYFMGVITGVMSVTKGVGLLDSYSSQ